MSAVALVPWHEEDRPLLDAANTPEMTRYLAGPETEEQLDTRHARYLRLSRAGLAGMFRIEVAGESVGSIGWWHTDWQNQEVCETGWFIVPSAQGRGYASRAVDLIVEEARAHSGRALLLAFPSVENAASNALCSRKGFRFRGEEKFPFRGAVLTVNAWSLSLDAVTGERG
ncbi:GNAT family N-acetyltransferase [Salinibacterium sp. SYSU T00001]|uniref:GNAT family N-acetyltransferase n=1 Tax=Homoserinimonas sedimenticola TaxID=2986805 RepID=UPI00223680CE|nr:GNAT family N-acetyltransferase [Salinibacterium sedimenticola]MCW4386180.1 GNAT family N-acetyltransferase [Salinibacterium sedimenticola]